MKQIIIIIIIIAIGFGIYSYFKTNNINPASQVKGVMSEIDTLNAMSPSQLADTLSGGLTGKVGNEFDKSFLQGMITDRQAAITMANVALVTSNHPELKKIAQNIIDTDTAQITQMKTWQQAWFPATPTK